MIVIATNSMTLLLPNKVSTMLWKNAAIGLERILWEITPQESMDRCIGRWHITEKMLKTVFNAIHREKNVAGQRRPPYLWLDKNTIKVQSCNGNDVISYQFVYVRSIAISKEHWASTSVAGILWYVARSPLTLSQTTRFLDKSKLKAFADDNFIFDENGRKFSKQVENNVGKGEIAHYEQFLLFPQCFQKTCTADT